MVITGVITARKGPSAEMDESKMKVGELAVATDKPVLWFCWAPGQVAKVALEGSAGGSSYTLPQADADTLGGVKAKAKTTETVEVAIDPATGKLYIPAGGGSITSDEIAAAVAAYIQANPITETDPTVPAWAKNPAPPTYTAEDVGADPSGTAVSKVSEHNASDAAHNDIRLLVQGLTNRLNTLADSDDTTLDQLSEIVAYIKSNKSLIDGITTGKINTADIINNLTTNAANKPLSAAQGVALRQMIESIQQGGGADMSLVNRTYLVEIPDTKELTIANDQAEILQAVKDSKYKYLNIPDGIKHWGAADPKYNYPEKLTMQYLRDSEFYANMWLPNELNVHDSLRYKVNTNGTIRRDNLNEKTDMTGALPWGICMLGQSRVYPADTVHFAVSSFKTLGFNSKTRDWELIQEMNPIGSMFNVVGTIADGDVIDIQSVNAGNGSYLFEISSDKWHNSRGEDRCFHFFPQTGISADKLKPYENVIVTYRIAIQETGYDEVFTTMAGLDVKTAGGANDEECFYSRFTSVRPYSKLISAASVLEKESYKYVHSTHWIYRLLAGNISSGSGGGSGSGGTDEGHTELNYINLDGNVYFDTGIIPDLSTNIELKIAPVSLNAGGTYIAGARDDNYKYGISGTDNFYFVRGTAGSAAKSYGFYATDWVIGQTGTAVTFNANPVTMDVASTLDLTESFYVGNMNKNGTPAGTGMVGKLYYLKLFNNETLVADLVPVRKSDGTFCLYDKVREIYINKSSTGNIQTNPIAETDPTVPAWAKNPAPPTYTAEDVGADPSRTAAAKVTEHNAAVDAHGDIRLLLQELANRVNTILDSDDTTLDQMSEIVAYIKSNKTLIDGITTGKINTADIINNLTTNAANKPLSAAQGVTLKGMIDAIVVPEALPNPHKLTFTGGVVAEYDGSGAVTVTIPDGSGGTGGTQRIKKGSTDTVVELQPNKLYVFPEMTTLTYTLAAGETGVANEYHFLFQSGATPTEVVHPAGVNIGSLTVEANKIYEISVMENCLTSQSWAVTV